MGYSSSARFSRAKPTGSFRVFQPGTRRVAEHAESLQDARRSATYWSNSVSSTMEIQERFPSGKWVTVHVVKPETTRKTAHATMKEDDAQLAKRETRLPDAGAKDTKKALTVKKAFNSKVERLLDQAGAKLHHEMKGVDSLDHREFLLETKAGTAHVTPLGQWNQNYFAWSLNEAVSDVARWLKRIAT